MSIRREVRSKALEDEAGDRRGSEKAFAPGVGSGGGITYDVWFTYATDHFSHVRRADLQHGHPRVGGNATHAANAIGKQGVH